MISVWRLTSPLVFKVTEIREFVLRVIANNGFPNPLETLNFLSQEMALPGAQVLLGQEDGKLVSLTITLLPGSPLMLYPQVIMAYNVGSRRMTRKLMTKVKEFVKEAGWNKCLCINRTGHDDGVFARAYRWFGIGQTRGSILEFEV